MVHKLKRSVNHFVLGEDDVAKLLKEVGVAADKENLKVMIEKLAGKSIPELIAAGQSKFASIPSGGSAPASSAPAAKEAPKKVEAAKVEEPEVDVDMGDLFGY